MLSIEGALRMLSLAMYDRPYFLFQIYSYSSKHLAAIISDAATNQY